MLHRLIPVAVLALGGWLLTVGVLQAAVAEPVIPDQWPAWLKKEMQSERKRRRRTRVLAAGTVQAKVFGKLAETQDLEGNTYFAVDIGTEVPVRCWVYAQPQYLSTTAKLVTDELLELNASAHGVPIKQRVLYYNDLGVLDASPYLATEWLWVIEREGQSSLGLLKLRAAQKEGTLFLCAHDQVGYRQTFAEFFERLLQSASWPHDYQAPFLREVVAFSVAGRPAGIAWNELRLDEDGDTVASEEMAMAMQVDDSTLSTSDSLKVEFIAPGGEVINAYSESAENGEVVTALSLTPNEGSGWSVAGRFQGKSVSFDLAGEAQPASVVQEYRAVRRVLRNPESKSVTLRGWEPDADPSAFVTSEFKLKARGRDRSTATLTVGPIAITGEYEHASGSMLSGALSAGNVDMRIERLFFDGALP